MSKTDLICDDCRTKVEAVFDPATGTRALKLISGQVNVEDCCYVVDEIHFTGNSQLVFGPTNPEKGREYCREYFLVCRKLVVTGGHKPGSFDPCGPDDPGRTYNNNNVITWKDRLVPGQEGAPPPPAAVNPQSFDRNVHSGPSDKGRDGGDGPDGAKGRDGKPGADAPNFTILALEVEIGPGDFLNIDFDGQNGGKGGKGQNGSDGGDGEKGRGGKSDTTWPGTGCDRQPGDGGDGGDGGNGGTGGDGGAGGRAGTITVVSTAPNISGSGAFLAGRIIYVNDGGDGGEGGKGGIGGKKGRGGKRGTPTTSECENALDGDDGIEGQPTGFPSVGSDVNKGATGAHGAGAGSPVFEEVETGTCADLIPLPPMSISSVTPSSGAQGTAVNVTIVGTGFPSGATVDVKGIGVSSGSTVVVDSATITSTFTIGAFAPKTARDVQVKKGAQVATLTDGFTVT